VSVVHELPGRHRASIQLAVSGRGAGQFHPSDQKKEADMAEVLLGRNSYYDKVYACWLGKNIGGKLMNFPTISETLRIERLQPATGKVRMVLDSDTCNEIDDQFAVVYSLLSPERLDVQALYAAPFYNARSSGPADGMEKSYQEILRLLDKLQVSSDGFVFRGSTGYLRDYENPFRSDAAIDLVQRAMDTQEAPLYVVAIGAITNVASAILIEPSIIEHIVVVWLGGHALHWPGNQEFNLMQDPLASKLLFDCGVPLVHVPCMGVTTHLLTTVAEIERYVQECGAIGAYLAEIFKAYHGDHCAWSKVLWDIATIAYLIDDAWVPTAIVHSPILTDQLTWSFDSSRHFIRSATFVHRDPIYRDLFKKLEKRRAL
jgi:inosine-uridine nucleoside N-ribohydrolase